MANDKVKYAELRPSEFRNRLQQKPLAYLPLGTLEWHGEHLPLGADALQSEALMMAAARQFGGIVYPPIFLGPDRKRESTQGNYLVGMDYALSTQPNRQLDGSAYYIDYDSFKKLMELILEQLERAGFKQVFADGHGPSRRTWVEMIPVWQQQFGLKLYGITEEWKSRWNYMNDHAARNETSITLHTHGSLVDLSVFSEGEKSPVTGVNGEHPYLSTAEYGEKLFNESLKLLGEMVGE